MRVLLIVPPGIESIEPFRSSKRIRDSLKLIKGFPLGLGYIAAVLEDNGIDVQILDAQIKQLSIEEVARFIKINSPDVIGITTITANIKTALESARAAKSLNQNTAVVFGGPHAMYDYENLLKNYDVDFVVIGEGEFIFLNLVKAIGGGLPLEAVEGVIYKEGGQLRLNRGGMFVDDLDSLPFPARHLTDFGGYLRHFTHGLSSAAQVVTSRGCPYKCAFCSSGNAFFKWRGRSARNIIAEMKSIIKEFPAVRAFSFMDDNFTLERSRVVDICSLLVREGLNQYPWDCLSRCGSLDEEELALMKEAGCVRIQYGIESGSREILENIGKGINLDEARKDIALTKKAGIEAYGFFMVGNPGESEETIKESVRLAFELRPAYLNWFVTQVYPGTKLARLQPQDDWVRYCYEPEIENPSLYTHPCVPTFNPDGFDREALKKKVAGIMRLFFWAYLFKNSGRWLKKMLCHPLYSLWYLKRLLYER